MSEKLVDFGDGKRAGAARPLAFDSYKVEFKIVSPEYTRTYLDWQFRDLMEFVMNHVGDEGASIWARITTVVGRERYYYERWIDDVEIDALEKDKHYLDEELKLRLAEEGKSSSETGY